MYVSHCSQSQSPAKFFWPEQTDQEEDRQSHPVDFDVDLLLAGAIYRINHLSYRMLTSDPLGPG